MQTFEQWLWANKRVRMPKEDVDERWFTDLGIHMVVQCTCCGKNIAPIHAYIDDEGYTYCKNCKGDD